jgi:transglutaminase-like putative cysteine protease
MSRTQLSQNSLALLKRHALVVMSICYLPHITTEPSWLFIIFLAAVGYRLLADYFNYPVMPRWMRFALVMACLFLLYGSVHSTGFLIRCLLAFIILKCLELNTVRDIKALILCNFFLIFSALLVVQELWTFLYLLIAILANLSILLSVSAPAATLRQVSSKSSQQLLLVIPLSLMLFYVFPRIEPLWQVPTTSRNYTGFNDKMSFGSISQLFNDDSVVMQIAFKDKPILDGYWRGIILSIYTGDSWNPSWYNNLSFLPLQPFKENETADYEIILEPNQTKWLFYTGYPVASEPKLLFLSSHGLVRQNNDATTQRFSYSLKVQPSPPYHVLNAMEYAEATQLPNDINPRLSAWAKEQFANAHMDVPTFIQFLHDYIHQQSFWYTLKPPTLNADKNQMDRFWFDTQKGFCEHYASAVTFILRAAGIPARVVMGFHSGQWNPISHTILIQRSDAHAWLEYWLANSGWQSLDPTAFIAAERIDQTIRDRQLYLLNEAGLPWWEQFNFILESVRFFSERWFLFYNQDTQQNLLQSLGLGGWNSGDLLQASIACMVIFILLLGLYYQWRQRQIQDPLVLEYHLLQKEFRRLHISTQASATLKQQCQSLSNQSPELVTMLSAFIHRRVGRGAH